jgi:ribonuclease P protein component
VAAAAPGVRRRTFPKKARVTSRAEFEAMQSSARKTSRGNVLALWIAKGEKAPRLGITASRKVGNAVARNTAKRWIREWFRKTQETLPRGLTLVVVVRRGAVEAGHAALDRDLVAVARSFAPAEAARSDA